MARATKTALFETAPSLRMLTRIASMNTTGQQGSSGRFCQAVTSSITASVTDGIRLGEASMP